MNRYLNFGGNSGVVAYSYDGDSIVVQFRDGAMYEYTTRSAGRWNIAEMKALAGSGRGLNAFINRHVRYAYARRLR